MNTESAVEFTGNCRLHVALTVSDLEASKRFYELLHGEPASKEHPQKPGKFNRFFSEGSFIS